MKYEYKDLPNFIMDSKGIWKLYSYSKVLVPMPESKEEEEALEE